jgi:hypothetical protein
MSQRTFPLAYGFRGTTRRARPMNACLIRCPTVSNIGAAGQDAVPPLGLAYIAASKVPGHHVTAVDAVGEAVDQYSRIPGITYALAHGLMRPKCPDDKRSSCDNRDAFTTRKTNSRCSGD